MLALSIVSPHGTNIASGKKTLEVRSWCHPSLPVRDLLIVENSVFLSLDMSVDPDGKVFINGPWESGYFDSPDGRKLYSVSLHFDKPEQRINFSLSTNNLKQGTYSLQIYFKGILIATLKKTFS